MDFQHKLLQWYKIYGRKLPWRTIRSPYYILLSELMLQQTQVARVLVKLPQFLRQFPDFATLAAAPTGRVISAWTGMGYNNRVLRFQKLAQVVVEKYSGQLPHNIKLLQLLPGIGKYTAHAVSCFSFGMNVPIVDVNVRRIYSRVHWKLQYFHEMRDEQTIWDVAAAQLPKDAFDYNQALMDLGAMVCSAKNPKCMKCPVASFCKSASRLVQGVEKKRIEPNRKGVPNRIYRGKIVEYLRQHHGGQDIISVAKSVVPGFIVQEKMWLMSLVFALEKDGLVVCQNQIIRLP